MADDDRSGGRGKDRGRGKGKGGSSEVTLHLNRIGEWDTAKNTVPVRVVGFMGSGPLRNTGIVFTLNGTQVLGSQQTDDKGMLEVSIPYTPGKDDLNLKAEAILPGKPSVPLKLTPPSKGVDPTDVELLIENTPVGEGEHFYYIVPVDKSGRPFEDHVTFMPKKTVQVQVQNMGDDEFVDHGEKSKPFVLLISKEGLRIYLIANKSGLYEIDAIPRKFPRAKKEIRIYGKRPTPIKANRSHHPLIRFWNGCL